MVNRFEGHINRIREEKGEQKLCLTAEYFMKDKLPNPYCQNLFVSEKRNHTQHENYWSVKPLYATRKAV
jgi:hypothetical protein